MPWCEECSQYLAPSGMNEDGSCPTCGRPVGEIEQRAEAVLADESTPWHFKLLVTCTVAYLVWRFVEIFV